MKTKKAKETKRTSKVKDLKQNKLTEKILYELRTESDKINDYWVPHIYFGYRVASHFHRDMGGVIARNEDDVEWNKKLRKQLYKRIGDTLKQLKKDGIIEQKVRKYRIKRKK